MHFALRDYQRDIVRFLTSHKKAYLGAFMGSGKTVSTLTALDALHLVDDVYPALIIAPLKVAVGTWPNEVKKFPWLNHIRVSNVAAGSGALARAEALKTAADIYTINYENIPWLVEELGGKWPFKTVICDEASKLKGFRTRQGTLRARMLSKVIFRSRRIFLLSGTPCSNGLQDLWGQYYFLDMGRRLFSTYSEFKMRWFYEDPESGVMTVRDSNCEIEIRNRIRDITLAVDPGDYMKVREPIKTIVDVELPAGVMQQYRDMESQFLLELSEETTIDAVAAASKSQKLLQIASGAVYDAGDDEGKNKQWHDLHDAKLDALEQIVEEAGGEPILVSYVYKFDLEKLQKRFPKAVALSNKPNIIERWNAGKIPMLLAHPKSAGHGINLQDGGRILVYYSSDWDLDGYDQIGQRLGSIRQAQSGHERTVYIYHLVAKGTIDATVLRRLTTKASIQAVLLEDMKAKGFK